jgi:hypothetical protein
VFTYRKQPRNDRDTAPPGPPHALGFVPVAAATTTGGLAYAEDGAESRPPRQPTLNRTSSPTTCDFMSQLSSNSAFMGKSAPRE